jgi:hypothetical protein
MQSVAKNAWTSSSEYVCRYTAMRRSLRRINDGYIDCLYGDDERNSDYPMIHPFRYRCQTVSNPSQYVSYSQLGNGVTDCIDGSDEFSREMRWALLKCTQTEYYACWVLKGDGIHVDRIGDVRLPFRQYCDSLWDTMDGRDERDCLRWICPEGLYRCNRTGQCIHRKYYCDGEFDCADGEDELNCVEQRRRWTLEKECHSADEHFCITADYVANQTSSRPCIPYTKAGDGQVNCIGARDERNVASCSDYRMLGDRFLCDNQTRCIDYTAICNGINDCVDRTDESICFWNRNFCKIDQYACPDEHRCRSQRCNSENNCVRGGH